VKDPNSYYAESAREFDFVVNAHVDGKIDTGIRVYDELEIDEKTSVITEKEISFSSPEETKRNYLKVIEVQELSEAEINNVNKFRLFFKKLFNVFFKGKKWLVAYGIFCTLLIALDIALENYFGAFIMFACLWVNSSPIKFAKEVKKLFSSEKKMDELKRELRELNLSGLEYMPKESIQLFIRDKQM
jgi:hypothetical protein